MKIDPGVIRNWALAAIAVASVFGGMLAYGKKVVAQEARKEAAAQMEPATKELGRITELLRRQEDRELFKQCMDYSHQEQAVEVRHQTCTRESNKRWAWWECDDETPGQCGPQP